VPGDGPVELCVVTPCYNEEEGIDQFYTTLMGELRKLPNVNAQVIFVDDGSADATLERLNAIAARDPRVLVYSLSRNFGHQVALTAGLNEAQADVVIMMDSDLQHPPSLIPAMVQKWREGFDIVSTVRESTEDATLFKKVASGLFYKVMNCFSKTPVLANAADFCLLSRAAHQSLVQMPERHRFLRGLVGWIGFRRTTISYCAASRFAGASKYTLTKSLRLAFDGLLSFSATPLRTCIKLGVGCTALGFLYLAYILIGFVAGMSMQPGWPSIIACLLVLNGLQMTFIGMIGEYIARVYEEVKDRPLYFFKQNPKRAAENDRFANLRLGKSA
jgi:glycosyltransferase involved in cell wall biosynthesis